ncbi:MAG: FISUMP domain-containing protein [Cyclobacteriaceae bacterium]
MKYYENHKLNIILLFSMILVLYSSCNEEETITDSNNNIITGSLTDTRDGTVYATITIGSQVWMAENLRYLPFVDGPATGSTIFPVYYVYGYDGFNVNDAKANSNYAKYGVLYNWTAANNSCPDGWHLPNDDEWTTLIDFLGGEQVAGGVMKEDGSNNWSSPNAGATNTSGFTALPAGTRSFNGSSFDFSSLGQQTNY